MACDFRKCGVLSSVDLDEPWQTSLGSLLLRLETPNDVRSVA